MKLPGIGEKMANRIIENRPYKTPKDLLKVPGIGPKTLEKIEGYLRMKGELSESKPSTQTLYTRSAGPG
jgi:Holliday junction resolvasome RuvABC DNA-binding subunit